MKAVKWYPAGATTNSDLGNPITEFIIIRPYNMFAFEGVKETELLAVRPTLLAMVKNALRKMSCFAS